MKKLSLILLTGLFLTACGEDKEFVKVTGEQGAPGESCTITATHIECPDGTSIDRDDLKGDKGDTVVGPKGDKGDRGATGATGAAGSNGVGIKRAYKTASGDLIIEYTDGRVVNVGNIKGDKGDQGKTGNTGATGAKGDKGDKGDAGNDGNDGVGIKSSSVDSKGHLILEYTNGNTVDVGKVVGDDGKDAVIYSTVKVNKNACTQVAKDIWVENINGQVFDVYYNSQCKDSKGEFCDNVLPSFGSSGTVDSSEHPGSGTTCWADNVQVQGYRQTNGDIVIKMMDYN